MSSEDLDKIALQLPAPLVQDWVARCRQVKPDIRRGDECPVPLNLPVENLEPYETLGIYKARGPDLENFDLEREVPFKEDMFHKPAWGRRRRYLIKHLNEMWEVVGWRKRVQAQKFQPHSALRADLVFFFGIQITWNNLHPI
jgi:hypothetical protein